MRNECRSDGYSPELGVHSECDVRHLADDVSSIAGFQGHLTEAKAATYRAASSINKQSLGAFLDRREKEKFNPSQ